MGGHARPAGLVAAGVCDERRDQNRKAYPCDPGELAGGGGIAKPVAAQQQDSTGHERGKEEGQVQDVYRLVGMFQSLALLDGSPARRSGTIRPARGGRTAPRPRSD